MRKNKKSLGFTMAELLVVVAIIVILAGVGFIAVQRYQRSMAQLERNAIAKEIFIAAQNHLTMAESQGYLTKSPDGDYFGKEETDANGKTTNVYYVIGPSSGNILDQILPFGSIDETVRSGGSYLIRYQTNPALVLDVFYCTTSGSPAKFNKDGGIKESDYSDLMANRKDKPDTSYVLGWYGSTEALESGDIILAPAVEIINGEQLIVKVVDNNNNNPDNTKNNPNAALKLIITGETSKAKLAITLTKRAKGPNTRFHFDEKTLDYTVILDDITTASAASPDDSNVLDGLHFADLNHFNSSEKKTLQFMQNEDETTPIFLPGENITVEAVAYSNTALTNIAYSSARTTNSLFADPGEDAATAMIANFRHLENLDAALSGLNSTLGFNAAEQIIDLKKPKVESDDESESDSEDEDDLSWTGFVTAIQTAKEDTAAVKIYASSDTTGTEDDCFRPISPIYALTYDGKCHSLEGIKVDDDTDAGLFGSLGSSNNACTIQNLELIDFSVKTSFGNAGALAGSLTNTTVTNVLAHNTEAFETALTKKQDDDSKARITVSTASGSAGGLIGLMESGTVQKSAAALIVKSTAGSAGGLIGKATDGTVSACYSGGHTVDKKNGNTVIGVVYDATNYNVTGTAAVGGLIGDAGATTITNSYSTCSATGATVGGLIGQGSGEISGCYCTGLVAKAEGDTLEGAFAGSIGDIAKLTGCYFFDIINERESTDASGNKIGGYNYLPCIGNKTVTDDNVDNIVALDADASTYNAFTGAPSTWKKAVPYIPTGKTSSTLTDYYGEGEDEEGHKNTIFNLRTVAQLSAAEKSADVSLKTDDTDTTVYFADTHYGDWPAPEIFVLNAAGT